MGLELEGSRKKLGRGLPSLPSKNIESISICDLVTSYFIQTQMTSPIELFKEWLACCPLNKRQWRSPLGLCFFLVRKSQTIA